MALPSPTRKTSWFLFMPVALAYAIVALQQIDLPGVYMDAVNPDYLVVKILNPAHEPIIAWVLYGNYLSGDRLPVLVALYHGSQQFWLGLPLYWLFGTSVEGIRLTHAVFALGVLAAFFYVLRVAHVRAWIAVAAGVALAIDPSFSYAFRTQSTITVAPCAWLLLALALLPLDDIRDDARQRGRTFAAGVFLSLAAVGYFIHAFFAPAFAGFFALAHADSRRDRLRHTLCFAAGMIVGGLPYIAGYLLIVREAGGIEGFLRFFADQQAQLNAFASPLPLVERIAYAAGMVQAVVSNAWHHSMIFGEWVEAPAYPLKALVLLALPVALYVSAELRREATQAQRLTVALPLSFFAVSLVFGNRVAGHHFIVLVPVIYAALAVGVANAIRAPVPRGPTRAVAAVLVLLLGVNVAGQLSEGQRLAETHGVELFSDAIDRLAADLNRSASKPFVYFPDWGLAMPVALMTRGTVGMDSVEKFDEARRMLCSGRDVAVALIGGDRVERAEAWRRSLEWDAPTLAQYRQHDGRVLFDLVTFHARADAPACRSA
jgi:hypothetical protein